MEMNNLCCGLFIHNSYKDFSSGSVNGVIVADESKGRIILNRKDSNYVSEGTFTSEVINTLPFQYLILSWNAEAPKGTAVKIEAQVLIDRSGSKVWSSWLSFGTWSSEGVRSSALKEDSSDESACIDTDTLRIKGSNGEAAEALRYRITLKTADSCITPVVRLIAGTIRNTNAEEDIPSLSVFERSPDILNLNRELPVARFSQMVQDPKIASVICSPTSITMILNYYGLNLVPEDTAAGVFDTEYDGYGNWPFNTAFAGNMGFEAYVSYCGSIYDLKKEIYNGHPLAVSVKYKNSEDIDAKLPVIHGAPIKKTNGHLIVVCGFVKENGEDYVIVNDPAAESNEAVRLKYLVEEFDAAWKTSGRVAYIIHP
jgi:uncharacterized protein YvpB